MSRLLLLLLLSFAAVTLVSSFISIDACIGATKKTATYRLICHASSSKDSNNLTMFRRVDKNKILHFEYYNDRWYYPLIARMPFLRPKPLLKGGMRTFITTSNEMDELIEATFNESDEFKESTARSVALMVYMWVSPELRGLSYGDLLLSNIITEARSSLEAEYLLIVHDDNGSGKLINYYKDRGFIPIFDKILKGMILKL